MTGNPAVDAALADMSHTIDEQKRIVRHLERIVSDGRRWGRVAVAGVVISLISVAGVAAEVNHAANERAELRCAETIERTAAIADAIQGAIDDVMDVASAQVGDDPDSVAAVAAIRVSVDARVSARLGEIPRC